MTSNELLVVCNGRWDTLRFCQNAKNIFVVAAAGTEATAATAAIATAEIETTVAMKAVQSLLSIISRGIIND